MLEASKKGPPFATKVKQDGSPYPPLHRCALNVSDHDTNGHSSRRILGHAVERVIYIGAAWVMCDLVVLHLAEVPFQVTTLV